MSVSTPGRTMKQQKPLPEPGAEPSVDDLLRDPIVRTFMAADGVDPDKLRDLLRSIAERRQARDRDRHG